MNNIKWRPGLVALISLFSTSLIAQAPSQPRVSTVLAVLTKALESKNASVGQDLAMRTISEVQVNNEVVIPRDSKLVGRVSEVVTRGKDQPQSILAIIIEKAVRTDEVEIPLQGIIAAVAAPQDNSLSSDPTYGMLHSNEPKMLGARPSGAAGTGELSASSKAGSTAAVATAGLKGRMDEPWLLNEDSQGAVGYEGLSLSWRLDSPPPVTIFSSKGKNVKLEAGTQMLLRLATPRLTR